MPAAASPRLLEAGDPARIAEELRTAFRLRTGRDPEVVACAPGRVNLIGEHLDYNEGRCLPLALPHATYAAVAPREDRVLSMSSVQLQRTEVVALEALAPGRVTGWTSYVAGVVWALEAEGWRFPGLDVVIDSRVPIGAGLSSSAALECAVALALLPVAGVPDTEVVRRRLVAATIRAETEMAGAPTGGLDQSVALLAVEAHALLLDFGDGSATPVPWAPFREGLDLLIVDTGVSHSLSDGGYAARRADCEAAGRALGGRSLRAVQGREHLLGSLQDARVRRRARHVLTEMDRVDAAVAVLERGEHAALGPLLDASHDSLRDDFEVSCDELDVAVTTCREHGALGARMTGGGFGGSAIALVPTAAVERVVAAVAGAFADRGWPPPAFLRAPAGPPGRRLR
jgi:galactokinase